MPDTITSINESSFEECLNLNTVNFGKGLQILGKKCFYNCWKVDSFTLPTSLLKISDATFRGCRFTSIDIPSNVNFIGKYCFGYNSEEVSHLEAVMFEDTEKPWLISGIGTTWTPTYEGEINADKIKLNFPSSFTKQ